MIKHKCMRFLTKHMLHLTSKLTCMCLPRGQTYICVSNVNDDDVALLSDLFNVYRATEVAHPEPDFTLGITLGWGGGGLLGLYMQTTELKFAKKSEALSQILAKLPCPVE